MVIISHKLKILDFPCLPSKYRLKDASHHDKNIPVQSVSSPVDSKKERMFKLLNPKP